MPHGNKDYINYSDEELDLLQKQIIREILQLEQLRNYIQIEKTYRKNK